MENKKSFILHLDSLAILDEMNDVQAGQLFKAILSFQKGNEPDLDLIVKMAFIPFRNQFLRDNEKWIDTKGKRASAGSKGAWQKQANLANADKSRQNTPVSVNENDNVSVKENEKVKEKVNVNEKETENEKEKNTIPSGEENTHPLHLFIKTLPEVSKIKTPLTDENCKALLSRYGEDYVKEILLAMENTKGIANRYTSVYLTIESWIQLRKSSVRITDPLANNLKRPFKPITPDQL